MLNRILPPVIDNDYRGHKLALWIFGIVIALRTIMSVNTMINTRMIAVSADGIPLDSYSSGPVQCIVALFALIGLLYFLICLLCIVVLVRYRSAVPLMFAFLLITQLGSRMLLAIKPIPRSGTPPGSVVTLLLLGLMIAGLALSLWPAHREAGKGGVDADRMT